MEAGGRSSMAVCYRPGESELTEGMGAAQNGGVLTSFYTAREGEG
jgi:hypothetical protein